MSDISKSSTSTLKRRISEIDDTIENLTNEVKNLKDYVYKTEFECSLMTVKLKREKVNALSAVVRSQMILADMDLLIAENDLFTDVERLKNLKILKLDQGEDDGKSQNNIPKKAPPPTTSTTSVQTTESMFDKKRKRKRSSVSPVDISQEETILIPEINEQSKPTVQTLQTPSTSFSSALFDKPSTSKPDSETALSSSIRAEFNKPFVKSQVQEPKHETPAKKQKLDKQDDSKRKSKNASKPKPTHSETSTSETVADVKKKHKTPKKDKTSSLTASKSKKIACSSTTEPVSEPVPPNNPPPLMSIPWYYINSTQPYLEYHFHRIRQ